MIERDVGVPIALQGKPRVDKKGGVWRMFENKSREEGNYCDKK